VAGAAAFRFEEKARFVIRRWQDVTLSPAHACRNASQSKAGSLIAFGRVPPRCRMILGPLGRLTEWMILPALRARTEHASFRSIPSVVLQPGLSLSAHSARFPGSALDYDSHGFHVRAGREITRPFQPNTSTERACGRLAAGGWRLAAGGWRLSLAAHALPSPRSRTRSSHGRGAAKAATRGSANLPEPRHLRPASSARMHESASASPENIPPRSSAGTGRTTRLAGTGKRGAGQEVRPEISPSTEISGRCCSLSRGTPKSGFRQRHYDESLRPSAVLPIIHSTSSLQ
jgi:hypothetical protein